MCRVRSALRGGGGGSQLLTGSTTASLTHLHALEETVFFSIMIESYSVELAADRVCADTPACTHTHLHPHTHLTGVNRSLKVDLCH